MATGWGVIHLCHGACGREVQYFGYKLFDAGTDNRHVCPNHTWDPPRHRWMECLCGHDIEIVGETRYDRGTIRLHVCRPAVTPAPKRPATRLIEQSSDKPGPVSL